MDEIFALLDDLEAQVNEGKKVPLTNNQYVINRDLMIQTIQLVRDNLPDAVLHANHILQEEARIKDDANNQYENILSEAETKARALTVDTKQRVDTLMTDAQDQADALYEDAQRQAQDLVANAERKAADLVSQTSIMVEADREANRILTEARAEAQRDRLSTLDHCDQMLRRAEDLAIDIANKLREERMSFDSDR